MDGFQSPGSFSQSIHYSASDDMIQHLVTQSHSCEQSLRYDCKQSRLHGPSSDYGWWVSWSGVKVDHWSGDGLEAGQCECGVSGSCVRSEQQCNCDSGQEEWTHDTGVIRDRSLLPVSQLHFGDTGTPFDNKEGRFTLGPLSCLLTTAPELEHSVHLVTDHLISQCPDMFLEYQWTSDLESGVLYELVSGGVECRLMVTRDSVIYQWRHETMLTSHNVTVVMTSLDSRWHSVNVEHNMVETSLMVDREHVASISNNMKTSDHTLRQGRIYYQVRSGSM